MINSPPEIRIDIFELVKRSYALCDSNLMTISVTYLISQYAFYQDIEKL